MESKHYEQDYSYDDIGNTINKKSTESNTSTSDYKDVNTGLNYNYGYVYQDGYAHGLYRAVDRYYNYDENGNISIERQGEDFEVEYGINYEQMHTDYWHSDHLGSATLITDYQGKEYERIEYTPYGELWIDQNQAYVDGYLPYRFTGKELDEETGLYYYGQRYFDPQYNIWMTSDPAIYDYMSQSKNGEGGIYNITCFWSNWFGNTV